MRDVLAESAIGINIFLNFIQTFFVALEFLIFSFVKGQVKDVTGQEIRGAQLIDQVLFVFFRSAFGGTVEVHNAEQGVDNRCPDIDILGR